MKLYLESVGLLGPGLPDWEIGRDILAGRTDYVPAATALAASLLLPAAERRRTTDTVKLALAVGHEAMVRANAAAETTPSVFSSSSADGATITAILEILASPEREVSPTRFHNSVHNAPSGYWGMATQSREPTTGICAHDFSFAAGLLEAACQVISGGRPVLLVAYDLPYPPALDAVRPIHGTFGTALMLSPERTARSLSALTIEMFPEGGPASEMAEPQFEALRVGNPAAQALPLLAAVARGAGTVVTLQHVAGNVLRVAVEPMA